MRLAFILFIFVFVSCCLATNGTQSVNIKEVGKDSIKRYSQIPGRPWPTKTDTLGWGPYKGLVCDVHSDGPAPPLAIDCKDALPWIPLADRSAHCSGGNKNFFVASQHKSCTIAFWDTSKEGKAHCLSPRKYRAVAKAVIEDCVKIIEGGPRHFQLVTGGIRGLNDNTGVWVYDEAAYEIDQEYLYPKVHWMKDDS